MARLDAEQDSVRAVLNWALQATVYTEGLRLVAALWRFWYMRGMLREGRRWLEAFLATPEDAPGQGLFQFVGKTGAVPGHPVAQVARAHALDGAAILAWRQGEYEQATYWLRDALERYRDAADRAGEARVLSHLGLVLADSGAFDAAFASYEASLAISRDRADSLAMSAVLHNLGNLHCQQNNNARALELYEECLAIYEQRAILPISPGSAWASVGSRATRADQWLPPQPLAAAWSWRVYLAMTGQLPRRCGISAIWR
ncbi:tetratricopeptide repeat protein [Candidatus Gracilibacteria bacterium]|nr:tetratricopeptide repeat protein [Candidatus Gracilibacteria bacterium]